MAPPRIPRIGRTPPPQGLQTFEQVQIGFGKLHCPNLIYGMALPYVLLDQVPCAYMHNVSPNTVMLMLVKNCIILVQDTF